MRIAVLAGGVGGSKFVAGVRRAYPDAEVVVVVNTADDITLHGLRVCPDLDTMMYTLGGAGDDLRGWGRTGESWRVMEELARYRGERPWFALGDLDLATHLLRTELLEAGAPLSQVTQTLCGRWLAADPALRLLPMSDDRVETHLEIDDPEAPGGSRMVHFQEYWVRLHATPEARAMVRVGIESARPAPGVLSGLADADAVLVAPSNPVVSIGPIVAVPGVRQALAATPAPVIGFAGILGGAPVLGMAHRLLPMIGVEVDAAAVGLHYGSRSAGGLLDAWVMADTDRDSVRRLHQVGIASFTADLMMSDPKKTGTFVRAAVERYAPGAAAS